MRKLPWPEIIITSFVIAVGAGTYLYAHRHESELEQSRQHGEEIVDALHAYHAERGTFPDDLAALVPEYAPRIAQPTWGLRRWRYRTYAADADSAAAADSAATGHNPAPADSPEAAPMVYFQLSVAADESGYPVLYYDFAARRWVLNN